MSHKEYVLSLIEQYQQKNLAYGNNAHKTFVRFGKAAYSMRLMDKFQRLENLIANPDIDHADESIEDTLGDAITYTIMFAADLMCSKTAAMKPSLEDDQNIDKTIEMLRLFVCTPEEGIQEMADQFVKVVQSETDSFSNVVYAMYLDENTTATDYVLLAAYLINIYMKGMKMVGHRSN